MPHYNFSADLEFARAAEAEAIPLAQKHFPGLANIQKCATKEYDFSGTLAGREIKFEVKWDLKATQTGNVAIEYESRGRPSGLSVTQADYLLYKLGQGAWYLLETAVLSRKLFDEKDYFRRVTGGDKGSGTKMFLVKVSAFSQWGERLA